jgi:D-aminopeptidase
MADLLQCGPNNLITDVEGIVVGNSQCESLKSGTTVLCGGQPLRAAVDVRGGAPGTRETDLLAPDKLVESVDAIVLSGGSAYGLDAASGVTDQLARDGRGYQVGPVRVPIVSAAILFDLLNGGDKDWSGNPYRALGVAALQACGCHFDLGSAGAGTGATCADYKGGLGSASLVSSAGFTVGALVAVNPRGSVCVGNSRHFWAAPFECDSEFGACGPYPGRPPLTTTAGTADGHPDDARANTTIAIIASDADLSVPQLQRVAIASHDGLARAIFPSHTPLDGDTVFAVSTAAKPVTEAVATQAELGHLASIALSRAVARAIYEAQPAPDDTVPCYRAVWAV